MREPNLCPSVRPAPNRPTARSSSELRVPFNPEAERSILGSILIVPALVKDLVHANLRSSDFYLHANRRIYQRILDLAQSSRPVDSISLAEELDTQQELELIGGYAYLSDLMDLVVPEMNHVFFTPKSSKRRRNYVAFKLSASAPKPPPVRLERIR